MNQYVEMKNRHQEMVNRLPLQFAFGEEQFNEMLEKNGWTIDDIEHIGYGGYINKKDIPEYKRVMEEISNESETKLKSDMSLLFDAIQYEMANHEYCITYDDYTVLGALGLSVKDFTDRMWSVYSSARSDYLKSYN